MNDGPFPPGGLAVLVSGDLINDHYVYTGERFNALDAHRRGVIRHTRPGGVALLYRLLTEIFSSAGVPPRTGANVVWSNVIFPPDGKAETCWEGYALWEPCAAANDQGKIDTEEQRWRSIRALGYGEQQDGKAAHSTENLPDKFDVIVLDDLGLDFRRSVSSNFWPLKMAGIDGSRPWVVLKTVAPVADSSLWRELAEHYADRLVVVTSAADLRAAPARISRGSSWERTLDDLSRELAEHPLLKPLSVCQHLIVRFGKEGVYWRARHGATKKDWTETLVFDPERIEGEWMEELTGKNIDGRVFGIKATLTASVVWALARQSAAKVPDESIDLTPALRSGLAAIRRLQLAGHGKVGPLPPGTPAKANAANRPDFPVKIVAEGILSVGAGFAVQRVPQKRNANWSLLGPADDLESLRRRAHGIAVSIVRRGPGVIDNVPYARFGRLQLVDRNEIEQYRTVRQLMLDYVTPRRRDGAARDGRPMAIAVFGAPGAGKSFGIKQVGRQVLGDGKPLEFNLSQFTGAPDLLGAFHQVRDRALEGEIPLVFWDEFDSREYAWLQYFLAPIQDGKFQEEQITHWIGRSIFVFAGGTSETWEQFGESPDYIDPGKRGEWEQNFRLRKGPDFKSRISGFLNILGPNLRTVPDGQDIKHTLSDVCCPIRRALLLRSMLDLNEDERWESDPALITALLQVTRFRHGARSLEKLLNHLQQRGGKSPQRAHLPSSDVLAMYFDDPAEFLSLCDWALPFQREAAARIGPHIHKVWQPLSGKSINNQDFNDLPKDLQEDNYAAARRIPELLSMAGLALASERSPDRLSEEAAHKLLEENIELLAETEHERWMARKRADGWQRGDDKGEPDPGKLLHPALLPYIELSEEYKWKDKANIRAIPQLVAHASFVIVPAGRGDREE